MAYIKNIGKNTKDSHQTSPSWVLTFVRWDKRDTFTGPDEAGEPLETRPPLVVVNDCVKVKTSKGKANHTGQMSATLLGGDIRYSTALSPGDFVIVNMLNWEEDAERVANNARLGRPINGPNDGFKGVYKIQAPRRQLLTYPNGVKRVIYNITGYSYTELNNDVYFNPFLLTNGDLQNSLLFITRISEQWNRIIGQKVVTNVQDIVRLVFEAFLGSGVSEEGRKAKEDLLKSPNVHFFLPRSVGRLLGVDSARAAKDIYNLLLGLQTYSAPGRASLQEGFNPSNLSRDGRTWTTKTPCTGSALVKAEYWNQVKTWNIMKQYLNNPINELYTADRIDPTGRVMPTVVMRQIPFSSDHYKVKNIPVTRFLSMPRWRIDPDLIFQDDLGKDEAARVNFVQVFGRSDINKGGAQISEQIARGNYIADFEDIKRHGLRPYVITSNFDYITDINKGFLSPEWSKILGDVLINGHLKENGMLISAGIVEPIAPGDNFEYDGIVYHIEDVAHDCVQRRDGKRSFRTILALSHGVDLRSDEERPVFPETTNPNTANANQEDWINEHILPGIAEAQNIPGRSSGEETSTGNNEGFDPTVRDRGGKDKLKSGNTRNFGIPDPEDL